MNLPPSIPISLDGEEGAYAYSQHLLQCNTDIKPECYQPPPNRTIQSTDTDSLNGHGASTKESARKGALPSLPYQQSSDYVSSSLLSSWRSSSTDRTIASRDVTVRAPTSAPKQQQRSSSADSVRKLVKRFFVRKLGSRMSSATKPEALSCNDAAAAAAHSSSVFGNFDEIEACSSMKGNTKGMGDCGWDLPPNYVDMIFTRDPVTKENVSDVVEKNIKGHIGK
jgi:hypothetical protein